MMIRTFHPIGQGAFYSERHDGFNVVYDCGEWKGAHRVDTMIEASFLPGSSIDCLFVSHFDYDHVSKLDILKAEFPIKRVVLPLLHKDEALLLSSIHATLGHDSVARLIRDSDAFFGEGTQVLRVDGTDPESGPSESEPVQIEVATSRTIGSGTPMVRKSIDWAYIPYNFLYKKRSALLRTSLANAGLDLSKIAGSDVDYMTKNRAKIRSVYDTLQGRINQNSMVLYSGPSGKASMSRRSSFHSGLSCSNWHSGRRRGPSGDARIACVYCGDSDLKVTRIQHVYGKHWQHVGVVQIPHHGDQNSFDSSSIANGDFLCPMSVGNGNIYGHPSPQVISEILLSGSHPILVTDDLDSIFMDILE
jgi:hypothetical protein